MQVSTVTASGEVKVLGHVAPPFEAWTKAADLVVEANLDAYTGQSAPT